MKVVGQPPADAPFARAAVNQRVEGRGPAAAGARPSTRQRGLQGDFGFSRAPAPPRGYTPPSVRGRGGSTRGRTNR